MKFKLYAISNINSGGINLIVQIIIVAVLEYFEKGILFTLHNL